MRCALLADFNAGNLSGYLANDPAEPGVETVEAPYGQVLAVLLDERAAVWSGEPPDAVVAWTRPEGVSESFGAVLDGREPDPEALRRDVDALTDAIGAAAGRARLWLVPTWIVPTAERGLGVADLRTGGVAHALAEMNARLVANLAEVSNAFALDARRWIEAAGEGAWSPKHWYLAKVPFAPAVFRSAVRDIKAALRALEGRARKLVIVDLDGTLWGGIVGDDGWENLVLGGHDARGEAYADFQRALRALKNRGVLLAIASRNDEQVALEAIRSQPEMALGLDDFAGWRINWGDKAENVADLVAELNLGLDSAVFIDDSAAERARVAQALPEVLVPDWPSDPMLYRRALSALDCFDTLGVSDEDRRRTELYASERARARARDPAGSLEDWLRSLELEVTIEDPGPANLKRIVQLLNKTNQMNLTTRRLTEAELHDWLERDGRRLWAFRVADRFADAGLTGVASVESRGRVGAVVDFVLSCRVFGRRIEQLMLAVLVEHARAAGLAELRAHYLATDRNRPCLEFWLESGFDRRADDVFGWDARRPYPFPEAVAVRRSSTR